MASGCAGAPVDGPPEIVYGQDICAECGMIISDPRFAAAVGGEVDGLRVHRLFDDIGDIAAHLRKHPELVVDRWYVHDYDSQEWLDGLQATYVVADDIRSPMGHGIAAFSDVGRATRLADEVGGRLASLSEILASDERHVDTELP